jgi:hypothetical protein
MGIFQQPDRPDNGKELVDCVIADDLTIGLKKLCSQVQLNGTIFRKGMRNGVGKTYFIFEAGY